MTTPVSTPIPPVAALYFLLPFFDRRHDPSVDGLL